MTANAWRCSALLSAAMQHAAMQPCSRAAMQPCVCAAHMHAQNPKRPRACTLQRPHGAAPRRRCCRCRRRCKPRPLASPLCPTQVPVDSGPAGAGGRRVPVQRAALWQQRAGGALHEARLHALHANHVVGILRASAGARAAAARGQAQQRAAHGGSGTASSSSSSSRSVGGAGAGAGGSSSSSSRTDARTFACQRTRRGAHALPAAPA